MIDIIETPSSLIKQILVQSLRKQVVSLASKLDTIYKRKVCMKCTFTI